MFDIGWTEILVIAVVMIVVVGPKDLPPMLRAFGKMTGNLRKMAGEFRAQFDDALRESEFDDVRKTISDAKQLNPTNALRDAINPLRQMGQDIRNDLNKATQLSTEAEKTDSEAQQAVEGGSTSAATAEIAEPISAAPVTPVSAAPVAPAVAATASPAPAAPVQPVAQAALEAEANSAKAAKATKTTRAKGRASGGSEVSAKPVKVKAEGVIAEAEKPKRAKTAAAKAKKAEVSSTEVAAAKPAARKRTPKKTGDTPKDDA